MQHLGPRLRHIGPGCVHNVLRNRPEVSQQHGYIHAGAISTIADSAGGYAAFTLFPQDTAVLTVEYKINLLAPAIGDHIEAVGTVLKYGRTLTVCQLEVFSVQGPRRSLLAAGPANAHLRARTARTVTTLPEPSPFHQRASLSRVNASRETWADVPVDVSGDRNAGATEDMDAWCTSSRVRW